MILDGRREWKNPGRSGCHLVAGNRSEPAIKDSSSDDGHAMSAPWRPSHSLAPAHASIGYLVNASLGAQCRNRPIAVIPAMMAERWLGGCFARSSAVQSSDVVDLSSPHAQDRCP
jgi:hypothetical protein